MGFTINLNGRPVHEVDIDPRLVTRVHLLTAAGEAGWASSPFAGPGNNSINIVVDHQLPDTLPMREDNDRLARSQAVESGEVKEILNYNENARREEAVKAIQYAYAEKATSEDVSVERGQAVQDAMTDSSGRDEQMGYDLAGTEYAVEVAPLEKVKE
jgi:hypothetical protein